MNHVHVTFEKGDEPCSCDIWERRWTMFMWHLRNEMNHVHVTFEKWDEPCSCDIWEMSNIHIRNKQHDSLSFWFLFVFQDSSNVLVRFLEQQQCSCEKRTTILSFFLVRACFSKEQQSSCSFLRTAAMFIWEMKNTILFLFDSCSCLKTAAMFIRETNNTTLFLYCSCSFLKRATMFLFVSQDSIDIHFRNKQQGFLSFKSLLGSQERSNIHLRNERQDDSLERLISQTHLRNELIWEMNSFEKWTTRLFSWKTFVRSLKEQQ